MEKRLLNVLTNRACTANIDGEYDTIPNNLIGYHGQEFDVEGMTVKFLGSDIVDVNLKTSSYIKAIYLEFCGKKYSIMYMQSKNKLGKLVWEHYSTHELKTFIPTKIEFND